VGRRTFTGQRVHGNAGSSDCQSGKDASHADLLDGLSKFTVALDAASGGL
jgi:hypothetical protein